MIYVNAIPTHEHMGRWVSESFLAALSKSCLEKRNNPPKYPGFPIFASHRSGLRLALHPKMLLIHPQSAATRTPYLSCSPEDTLSREKIRCCFVKKTFLFFFELFGKSLKTPHSENLLFNASGNLCSALLSRLHPPLFDDPKALLPRCTPLFSTARNACSGTSLPSI